MANQLMLPPILPDTIMSSPMADTAGGAPIPMAPPAATVPWGGPPMAAPPMLPAQTPAETGTAGHGENTSAVEPQPRDEGLMQKIMQTVGGTTPPVQIPPEVAGRLSPEAQQYIQDTKREQTMRAISRLAMMAAFLGIPPAIAIGALTDIMANQERGGKERMVGAAQAAGAQATLEDLERAQAENLRNPAAPQAREQTSEEKELTIAQTKNIMDQIRQRQEETKIDAALIKQVKSLHMDQTDEIEALGLIPTMRGPMGPILALPRFQELMKKYADRKAAGPITTTPSHQVGVYPGLNTPAPAAAPVTPEKGAPDAAMQDWLTRAIKANPGTPPADLINYYNTKKKKK